MTPSTMADGELASSTARNMTNLANQPANGGMPASENKKMVSVTASPGDVLAEAGVRVDLGTAGAPGHRDDHRERAEVHRRVDEEVDEHRLERRDARTAVARDRERHEDETTLRDRRVGEHAHDVGLAQRNQVAVDDRRRGQDPQHRFPRVLRRQEAEVDDREQGDEAARLRRHREERGDRSGRTLVGVGCPEVERDGTDFEREPGDGQEDGDGEERARAVDHDVIRRCRSAASSRRSRRTRSTCRRA